MSTTRPITELDFDIIKSEIINFIKTNPAFSDYSFEGSALNAIIDILAFNTHTNAYYGNMIHNEGFIETAQKRGSVVSKAKELGYVPRSCVGSTAFVDVTAFNVNTGIPSVLSRGTSFSSDNDNGSFKFSVVENLTASIENTNHKFSNVRIVNGTNATNLFVVNTQQNARSLFTIPNQNIDISTLKVYVRDSFSAVEREEYTFTKNIYAINGKSKVFYVQESYTGDYNVYFGNNVVGKQPVDGNVIDVDYFIVNNFSAADNCRTFVFDASFGGVTTTNVATKQYSFGGSQKEEIDSIKINAVNANSAKERAVTEIDYGIVLREKFNFIESASVWGGEKNVPPVYGKVFISVKPVSGFIISDTIKKEVLSPLLKGHSLLTVTPVFIDPDYLNIELSTKIKFNNTKTTTNRLEVEGKVKTVVVQYINSISKFNADYLESLLVSQIASLDAGIMSVSVNKNVSVKFTPLSGIDVTHKGSLNNAVLAGSIRSTKFSIFTDTLVIVSIKEIPNTVLQTINGSGKLDIFQSVGLYTVDGNLIKNIGTVNLSNGDYKITFAFDSYLSNNKFISVRFGLVENDIKTLRNQVLNLDVIAEDSVIGFPNNNIVIIEAYDK